ncbi:hypothetical protein [Pyrodictium abyssi]|uniref:Uncharacterized protein n=1 Tax=Pyrodictium abyssi TaxID=54256 RepID=A0ABN6ZQ97_9CREN|nr:hypothetical protein PABY_19500 [Pyrodictium abyssi]
MGSGSRPGVARELLDAARWMLESGRVAAAAVLAAAALLGGPAGAALAALSATALLAGVDLAVRGARVH